MFKKFISLSLIALMFSSCASIFSGSEQEVNLSAANGDNVVVRIGDAKHTLPARVKLKRRGENIQILESDNPAYQSSNVNSASLDVMGGGVNPIYWTNLIGFVLFLVPGFVGTLVDVSTGAAYQYSNEHLVVPVYKK